MDREALDAMHRRRIAHLLQLKSWFESPSEPWWKRWWKRPPSPTPRSDFQQWLETSEQTRLRARHAEAVADELQADVGQLQRWLAALSTDTPLGMALHQQVQEAIAEHLPVEAAHRQLGGTLRRLHTEALEQLQQAHLPQNSADLSLLEHHLQRWMARCDEELEQAWRNAVRLPLRSFADSAVLASEQEIVSALEKPR